MAQSRRAAGPWLEWLFYALAAVGLIGTQPQITRMPMNGFIDATTWFWLDVISRPASLFLTVDILVLSAVVFIWMFSEARRLDIRFVWIYFLGGLLIAVSFFVPLFMGIRQRRLRMAGQETDTRLTWSDWIGVGITIVFAVAAAGYSIGTVVTG
jgi:hypothetical protein